jgi:hypothetical protein
MSKIKYRFVLIETSLTSDHFDLSPAQFTRSAPGRSLISWLCLLSIKHGINIIPVGASGKQYCQLIFQNIVRLEKDRWVTT